MSAFVGLLDGLLYVVLGRTGVFTLVLSIMQNLVDQVVDMAASFATVIGYWGTQMYNMVYWTITYFWGAITTAISIGVNPLVSIWDVLSDVISLFVAWWDGTSAVYAGNTYDYSGMAGVKWGDYTGGKVFFYLITFMYVCMIPARCAIQMNLEPIMEPVRLFINIVTYMTWIMTTLWNITSAIFTVAMDVLKTVRGK